MTDMKLFHNALAADLIELRGGGEGEEGEGGGGEGGGGGGGGGGGDQMKVDDVWDDDEEVVHTSYSQSSFVICFQETG